MDTQTQHEHVWHQMIGSAGRCCGICDIEEWMTISPAPAQAELTALRARVLELESPRTCATCKWNVWSKYLESGFCENDSAPVREITDDFGCIHHTPRPGAQ